MTVTVPPSPMLPPALAFTSAPVVMSPPRASSSTSPPSPPSARTIALVVRVPPARTVISPPSPARPAPAAIGPVTLTLRSALTLTTPPSPCALLALVLIDPASTTLPCASRSISPGFRSADTSIVPAPLAPVSTRMSPLVMTLMLAPVACGELPRRAPPDSTRTLPARIVISPELTLRLPPARTSRARLPRSRVEPGATAFAVLTTHGSTVAGQRSLATVANTSRAGSAARASSEQKPARRMRRGPRSTSPSTRARSHPKGGDAQQRAVPAVAK